MPVSTASPQFDPGSFRDPDTKVFRHNGVVLRCLTPRALADWEQLAATDFFKRLTAERHVIPIEQVGDRTGLPPLDAKWAAVLKHETVPMVRHLFSHRDDQDVEYSVATMEAALARYFGTVTKETLESGTRILYHARTGHGLDGTATMRGE